MKEVRELPEKQTEIVFSLFNIEKNISDLMRQYQAVQYMYNQISGDMRERNRKQVFEEMLFKKI